MERTNQLNENNTNTAPVKKIDTLFLIDDDSIYQFLTKKVIEETKIVDQIKIFSNGLEAIEFLDSVKDIPNKLPDIILLDLSMPIMDGWEFLDEYVLMKPRFNKKITLYIVSSSIAPSDIEKARSISAVSDFIVKPITKEKLMAIIKNLDY
jgi:CheY-like chemotaxis protein